MTTRKQILEAGKELALIDATNPALYNARDWWRTGNQYPNHDFDVLSGLSTALGRLQRERRLILAEIEDELIAEEQLEGRKARLSNTCR